MTQTGAEALWVCGTLGKAHGLRGELYLDLAPGGIEYLALGERFWLSDEGVGGPRPCALARAGGTDRRPLVRLDLATTREEAVALQGRVVLASGGALDDLPRYRAGDLIGRVVREAASGAEAGTVVDVLVAPAHDVLELRAPEGGTLLVPLVDELVWDDGRGGLTLRAGLLDLGGEAGPEGAARASAGADGADGALAAEGTA